ncbi:unnamed protein product [Laminaria digitata]
MMLILCCCDKGYRRRQQQHHFPPTSHSWSRTSQPPTFRHSKPIIPTFPTFPTFPPVLGEHEAIRRDKVNMTFVEDDGTEVKVEAELGATLLEVAHDNDVELEGACGGDLACSTCHVVLPKEYYDKLDEKEEEEDDMLDLAWGLTDTSRLGCQIKVTKELEGMLIKIPEDTMDMS